MLQPSDAELLAACRASHDRGAMELIVRRHIGFVYASALRQVRARRATAHLADDITQAVFIVLAQKASKIRSDVMLRDWLFVTTRYAAKNALRMERRRAHHERIAAARRAEAIAPANETMLDQLSPLLDEGIASLGESERRGVLMSFFDDLPFREIGRAFGISEDAARKRVGRAVDKLRRFFVARGLTIDSTRLADVLHRAASSSVAPATLVASTVTATGATVTALSIAKGTGTIMAWMKLKSVAAMVAVCCATGVTVSAVALTEMGPGDTRASSTQPVDHAKSHEAAPVVAKFPDGMSIELLGVTQIGSRDGAWWTPNGAATTEQCEVGDAANAWTTHQICARFEQLPDGSSMRWKTNANVWVDRPARRSGTEVPGLFNLLVGCENKRTLDVTCKIASAEWVTLAECKARGTMCQPFDQGSVAFAPMYEQDGGTCLSVAHDIEGHEVRLQAIDGDGVAHPPQIRVINSPGKLVQLNVFFDLPMDKIEKVEVQTRPYDHVATFHGITLDPGEPSHVEVVLEDKK